MFDEIKDYIIDCSSQIDGYLGAMLIGSEATGYSVVSSDIDIHIFVDQTQKKSSISWKKIRNRPLSTIIYPIDTVVESIAHMAEIWSYLCKRMYHTQWVIIDDPYDMVKNIKNMSHRTDISKGYSVQDIEFMIGWCYEFQRMLTTLDIYCIDNRLFYIFSQYSFFLGYDHYDNFWFWFWKVANRIFIDDQYALTHRWMIYPDKQFIVLRQDTYHNRTIDNINTLINYTISQLHHVSSDLAL